MSARRRGPRRASGFGRGPSRHERRRHRQRLERRRGANHRLGAVEQLESRQLLAFDPISVGQMRELLEPNLPGITRVTVVTHGFQPPLYLGDGDSLLDLAKDIAAQVT